MRDDERVAPAANIGTEAVVRAPPDGYTLLLVGGPPALGPVGDQTLLGRRRGRLGRHPVMRRLLIGISELQQHRLALGQPKERYANRQIVAGEPGRHIHGGSKDQKRVQRRDASVGLLGRIDAVLDQARLMLHRLSIWESH
jgi:hypothetical protein